MSNIVIKGAATGSGTFTLEAPATNTNRALVLPDEAGTVLTSVSNIAAANLTGALLSSAMPAGSVLRVVSAVVASATSTQSQAFINTPLALAITPTSASSKILILISAPIYSQSGGTYSARYAIFRGTVSGANLGNSSTGFANIWSGGGTALSITMSMMYLDSPNTTSSQTYTVGMRNEGNSQTSEIMSSNTPATITLMEIAT